MRFVLSDGIEFHWPIRLTLNRKNVIAEMGTSPNTDKARRFIGKSNAPEVAKGKRCSGLVRDPVGVAETQRVTTQPRCFTDLTNYLSNGLYIDDAI